MTFPVSRLRSDGTRPLREEPKETSESHAGVGGFPSDYFSRYSTPFNISTICSAAHNSVASSPVAACFSAASTCCHVDFARLSFGRCPSSARAWRA